MAFQILTYIATIFITHQTAALIQVSLHCLLGHRAIGGSIYEAHLYHHHGIYSGEIMVSEKYMDEAKSLDLYYAIPGVITVFSAYVLVPLDLFLVHLSSLIASISTHLYLHKQYHLRESWLRRFPWFRKKQQLHIIHHKDMTKNYAVVEFFWDKALGTYAEAPIAANLKEGTCSATPSFGERYSLPWSTTI